MEGEISAGEGGEVRMYSFDNREMDEFFQTLSPLIQHSIIMCDLKPRTLEELQKLAETMAK